MSTRLVSQISIPERPLQMYRRGSIVAERTKSGGENWTKDISSLLNECESVASSFTHRQVKKG